MEIIKTTLNSKKDIINAGNASGVLKDYVGQTLTMTGAVIYSETDKDGDEHVVTSIKTDHGFIGSTSANVRNTAETIMNEWAPDELISGVPFVVRSAKSKNGREFLSLELV